MVGSFASLTSQKKQGLSIEWLGKFEYSLDIWPADQAVTGFQFHKSLLLSIQYIYMSDCIIMSKYLIQTPEQNAH